VQKDDIVLMLSIFSWIPYEQLSIQNHSSQSLLPKILLLREEC